MSGDVLPSSLEFFMLLDEFDKTGVISKCKK